MNETPGLARRYHWHSANVRDFVDAPHTGIAGEHQGDIVNLVDAQAKPAQNALLAIARESPETTLNEIRHLTLPRHHDVRRENVDLKRLGAVLAVAYENDLRRVCRSAAGGESRTAHTPDAGVSGRSRSRNARALFRSRPLLVCAGRQGRPSVSGTAQDLRRIDWRAAPRRSTRRKSMAAKSSRVFAGSIVSSRQWSTVCNRRPTSKPCCVTNAASRHRWADARHSAAGSSVFGSRRFDI